MLASYKKGRDSSGHSVQATNYRVSSVPSRCPEFPELGTEKSGTVTADSTTRDRVPGHSPLDCALATTRPMSRTETAVE